MTLTSVDPTVHYSVYKTTLVPSVVVYCYSVPCEYIYNRSHSIAHCAVSVTIWCVSPTEARDSKHPPPSAKQPDTKGSSSRSLPAPGSKIPRSPVKPVKNGVAGKTSAPPTGGVKTRKPTAAAASSTARGTI